MPAWEVTNSQQLGARLQVTPAQIRKDLSYFGRFGKQGRGYRVRHLLTELKQILGLDSEWNVAVVGVGRLGNAILNYPGFNPGRVPLSGGFRQQPGQRGAAGRGSFRPADECDAGNGGGPPD